MIICPNLLVGYYWGSTARFIGVFIVNHQRDDIYYITKQIQIVHWDGMIGMGVYFMAHTTYQGIRAYQGAICICALSELLMSLVCAKESFWNSGLACCSARHIIKQYISSTGIDTYIHIIHSYVSYVYMRICRSLTLNSGSHTHTIVLFDILLSVVAEAIWAPTWGTTLVPSFCSSQAWPCDLVVFSIAELDHGPMDCLMMIS